MSFEFDTSTDVVGDGSYQGQLASSYTNALSEYLQGEEGADYVAFLAYQGGMSVADALLLKAAIISGDFDLSGLFGAAQSKTGEVDGALIADPVPMLTVNGVTIDLSALFAESDTDTASWETITKKLDTIFHTREFYTTSGEPDGYDSGWADGDENQAPTADEIVLTLTEYDEHDQAKSDADLENVNLLTAANAADADGDALSVVAGSVTLADDSALPDYISYADGILSIDKNHSSLDALYLDDEWSVAIKYQITDGQGHTITNTVDLTITGTADQFTGSTDVSASVTSGFNTTTWDGAFNFTLTAPTGAFDFAGTATVTATGDIDLDAADNANDEVVSFTLEGGTAVTLGALEGAPNQEPPDYTIGQIVYGASTDSDTATFASADATVTVTYDSNIAGGANGVDGLSLVGVAVTADYTYWL